MKYERILLSSPEALALIEKAKQHDTDAMARLIAGNTGIIRSIVRRFKGWTGAALDIKDLEQWGVMGFMSGVRRCDPRKPEMTDYICVCIRHSILSNLRDRGTLVRSPQSAGKISRLPIESIAEEMLYYPNTDHFDNRDMVETIIGRSKLVPLERETLLSAYGIGRDKETCLQLSRRLGLSAGRARNLLVKAKAKVQLAGQIGAHQSNQ